MHNININENILFSYVGFTFTISCKVSDAQIVITLQEEARRDPSFFQLRLWTWSPCCSKTADTLFYRRSETETREAEAESNRVQ